MQSKNYLLFLLLLFPVSLLAVNGNLSSYQIGYSSNQISTVVSDKRGGFYSGIDFLSTSSSGLGFGIGFDLNVWDGPSSYDRDATMFSMGGSAKLGYTFQSQYHIPLKLKAGIGYGVIKSIDDSGWGVQYEAGAEYLLTSTFGIGIKYKHAEAELLGETFKNDSSIIYLMFGK